MNRLAQVVAKNNHAVILKLLQSTKCSGCPSNCNEPLFKLFNLKSNLFALSTNHDDYQLVDEVDTFKQSNLLGQIIKLEIETNDLLKSSATLYLLPLLICMVFVILGHFLGNLTQLSSDFTSLFGLLFGFLAIYMLFKLKKPLNNLKFRPKVTIL